MSDPPPRPRRRRPDFAVVLIAVVLGLAVLALPILLFVAQDRLFGTGGSTASGGGLLGGSNLPAPPPAVDFGTAREIGTRGDDPNPHALYHGAYPSNDQTQERRIGGRPARFSGYTAWVRSVTRVRARGLVDAYSGDYLRVHVTVFNRDTQPQQLCACDFYVYSGRAGVRAANLVRAPTFGPERSVRSGATLNGNVYLYVGRVAGPLFVVFDPDGNGRGDRADDLEHTPTADAVWQVPAAAG
jgi:hypothetical protein